MYFHPLKDHESFGPSFCLELIISDGCVRCFKTLSFPTLSPGRNLNTLQRTWAGKVAGQHIVFVCIKICAIEWTIKCPFVIFIGLQCCKMLKAFIFSRAMTKARSSIVHGHNVDQSIFYIHFFFIFLSYLDDNNAMLWQSHQEGNWIVCWLIVVGDDHWSAEWQTTQIT